MKKEDLKNGMLVEYANQKYALVYEEYLLSEVGWCNLNNYSSNLINHVSSNFNINKVYSIFKKSPTRLKSLLDPKLRHLLWNRDSETDLYINSDIDDFKSDTTLKSFI